MPKLADLFVNLSSKGVTKVKGEIDGVDKKTRLAGKAVGMLKTAIISLGAVGVLTAIRNVINEFKNYAVEMDEMHKKTGISVDMLQRLKYACDQEHASLEALNKGLRQLVRSMDYARDGQKLYLDAYKKLGVEVKNADGTLREVQDVFYDVADAIGKMESDTEATAVSLKILGRSGGDLIPLFKLGKEELHRLGDEAQRLGIVLDEETVVAAKKFDDELVRVNRSITGVKFAIAEDLLPILTDLLETIQELKPIYDFLKTIDQWWLKLNKLAGGFWDIRTQLGIFYDALKKLGIIKTTTEDIGMMSEVVVTATRPTKDFGDAVKETTEEVEDLTEVFRSWGGTLERVEATNEKAAEMQKELNKQMEIYLRFMNILPPQIERVVETTGDTSTKMTETAQAVQGFLTPAFQGLFNALIYGGDAWGDFGARVEAAIKGIIIQLMALASVGLTLKALGLEGLIDITAAAMRIFGGFQTPKGDWWAYKEGSDFGKFFLQGFTSRMNAAAQNINMGRETTIFRVYAEPGIIVEKMSGLPFNQKEKFHREIVKTVENRT